MIDLKALFFAQNSPTFKKLFPEYLEKYEQQLATEQSADQAAQESVREESSRPTLKKRGSQVEPNSVDVPKEVNNQQKRGSFPTWLSVMLVCIFAAVMALPLLQL